MSANTVAIANAIVTLQQSVMVNSAPFYTYVKVGAIQNPTNLTSYCSITFKQGKTVRYKSGWTMQDCPEFVLESGFDMTDSTVAETALMTCRDLLIPMYAQDITLNNLQGVTLTRLDVPDDGGYKGYSNGKVYRVHLLHVKPVQYYTIPPPQ